MRHHSRRPLSLLLALSLSLSAMGAGVARAQSPSDVAAARQLFREGSQLSQEGKWEQARQRFEQSLQLRRAAITLYSLGVAQKQTGQLLEALESLRAFLHWPPNEATDPYVPMAKEMVDELEKRVGKITLRLLPQGAPLDRFEIDGAKLGDVALEVPRLVNPGKHELLAVASDGREGRVDFTLGEGESLVVTVELGRRTTLAPGGASPGATTPPPAARPPKSRVLPVALLAGGGAVALTGVVVGLIGVSQAKGAPAKDSPEVDSARSKALVGDILGGVGVIAAGVGGYLLLRGSSDTAEQAATPPARTIRPWVGLGSAGLSGTF